MQQDSNTSPLIVHPCAIVRTSTDLHAHPHVLSSCILSYLARSFGLRLLAFRLLRAASSCLPAALQLFANLLRRDSAWFDMTSFADLPYEVVDQVILNLLPADLETFAQACRKVNSVARPRLKAHRAWGRNFATVGNNINGDGSPFGEVLFDILKKPLHAHYIVNLHYRRCFHPPAYEEYRVQQDFRELITLLPNLKTLTMEDVDVSRCMMLFLNASFTDPPILTKLASVYVRFPDRSVSPQSLGITRALSTLPSLRLLSTQNCRSHDMDPVLFAQSPSLLTRLELWDCSTQSKELHDFLRYFNRLQTFKHSTPSVSGPEVNYNPFWIRNGLLYSKSTLQHLTLLAPGRPASFVGSLVDFEFLEEVYISWGLLDLNWSRRVHSDLSLVLPKPLRLLRIQSEGGQSMSMDPRLAKCIVDGGGCAWDYSRLVESVIVCRSFQTQNLSELVLLVGKHWRCSKESFSSLRHDLTPLQRRCIEAGIVLTIN